MGRAVCLAVVAMLAAAVGVIFVFVFVFVFIFIFILVLVFILFVFAFVFVMFMRLGCDATLGDDGNHPHPRRDGPVERRRMHVGRRCGTDAEDHEHADEAQDQKRRTHTTIHGTGPPRGSGSMPAACARPTARVF